MSDMISALQLSSATVVVSLNSCLYVCVLKSVAYLVV